MSELRLDILGVQEDDEKGKAAVNNMFAKVSAHVPPLNVAMQIYLPTYQPKTQLFNCTTGMSTLRWKKKNLAKSGGLTKFLAKLSRSLHMNWVFPIKLYSSFEEGIVPSQWNRGLYLYWNRTHTVLTSWDQFHWPHFCQGCWGFCF